MCQIIDYGFGRSAVSTIGNSPCTATTDETIYGIVNGLFDLTDVGVTYKGSVVFVYTDGTEIEVADQNTFTPTYSGAMHIFAVSLKNMMSVLGNYAIRGSYIRTYPGNTISCLDSISASCTDLTLTQACVSPVCSFALA